MSRVKRWSQTRRDFLAGAAGGGTAWLAGGPVAAPRDLGRPRTISIFHTSDLHGRIWRVRSFFL
jgi:2',3'-cyclic-nucleotide 2'-phosphodiesterase (5'-nucleotidase family)